MNPFLFSLAWRSAFSRRLTLSLIVMLLAVERIRVDLRDSFTSAVSGTDLIVGARTGAVQLLLYSVFRVGAATNNIRWRSVEELRALPGVRWVVPLSLGDSHRGFPVVATSPDYFDHFRHGEGQALQLRAGERFSDLFDAVIGAEVADRLGYRVGSRIVLAHGRGELNVADHGDKPFTIAGVLARTGTPVDRSVHISLQAMEALHVDWFSGIPLPGKRVSQEAVREMNLQPRTVTAALVGLENRAAVFSVQRQVNNYRPEPLLAILPGVALDEMWQVLGTGERAVLLMSGLVALVSMAGLMAVVLTGLNERRRELAVLRTVGASPIHIVALLLLEGFLITLAGVLIGALALLAALLALAPWLQAQFGLTLHPLQPTLSQGMLVGLLLLAGMTASLLPAWLAYRISLADGLAPRA